ncbi:MAG: MopE-related protein [Candidatus Altarchaeum sp.]|nr:MopE-related protein [Candidatus Altarchaeum sp.]
MKIIKKNWNRVFEKIILVGVVMAILNVGIISAVTADSVNATIYIDDDTFSPGYSSVSIPVNINISQGSNNFGYVSFVVFYDGNVLNATNVILENNISGDCIPQSSDNKIGCVINNKETIVPYGISGNFSVVFINFTILNPQQSIGTKTNLNMNVTSFKDVNNTYYNYLSKNGSIQINCTNNSQCGANNICNQSTHLCQATTITCYRDFDNDTYGNATNTTTVTGNCPSGYVTNNSDCNDYNNSIKPGATEIYNQIDDNCNEQIDEGLCTNASSSINNTHYCNASHYPQTKKADNITPCSADYECLNNNCFNNTCRQAGWNCGSNGSAINTSHYCNTTHSIQNKKATGQNCSADYECLGGNCNITCQGYVYYKDADNDGFGDNNVSNSYISSTDNGTTLNYSGFNYTKIGGDCNDANSSINPNATDNPNNGIDENCNRFDNMTYYRDADNDTYGNATNTQISDSSLSGYITNVSMANDCDDNNSAINPNTKWYVDNDNDGYGNTTNYTINCTKPTTGNWTLTPGDCDDTNNLTLDAKIWYVDNDNDTYGNATNNVTSCSKPSGNYTNNSLDCNDNNASINPGVTLDILNNGIDENCNGFDNKTYYRDADNDTYGNATNSIIADTSQTGYVTRSDKFDCNDNNANINPGVAEFYYDGIDNDCNGIIDACNEGSDCSGSNYNCISHKCYKKESTSGFTGTIDLSPPTPATNATLKEFSGVPGEVEDLTLTFNLGKDAKGASVTATVGNKTNTAIANDNGTVTITLPGYGQGEITASKTGFKPLTKTISVYAGILNITKISGEKYGDEFKFKITTKNGNPVKDARVEIYGKTLKTDADGIVKTTIKTIQAGLEASASANNYKDSSVSFDVKAKGTLKVDAPEKVKQGDTITITITDENKNPVTNAKVIINGVEQTADANGKIEYKVTTTLLTLKAESEGYIPSKQTSVTVEAKIECGNRKCEAGETKENCAKDCIICGDNVCDTGESYENCASDCKKPEEFPLWIIGILLVILLVAAYYFMVMRKKKEGEEMESK